MSKHKAYRSKYRDKYGMTYREMMAEFGLSMWGVFKLIHSGRIDEYVKKYRERRGIENEELRMKN
jgi:hypothetical protein